MHDGLSGENGVADTNDPVGFWVGREGQGGKTVAQMLAGQPELVTNGGFDAGSNWTGDAAISSGQATISGTGEIYQEITGLTVDQWYKQEITVTELTGLSNTQLQMRSPSGGFVGIAKNVGGVGTASHFFQATSATMRSRFFSGSASVSVDDMSIKEILTSVMTAPATGSQPTILATEEIEADNIDDAMGLAFPSGAGPANANILYASGSDLVEQTGRDLSGSADFTIPDDLPSWGAKSRLSGWAIFDAGGSGDYAAMKSAFASKYGVS